MGTSMQATGPQAAAKFRQLSQRIAGDLLVEWVGKERAGLATGRISAALASAAACAKKPEDFYACTPQSIGSCIALSALTGIMPGVGSTALAYLIPRSPRKNEPKQLTYQLSHRGIAALARRSGQHITTVPIGMGDTLNVNADGDVLIVDRDIDDPPLEWDDLRGVVVVIKEIATGLVVARGWCPTKIVEKRRAGSDAFVFAERKGNEWAKQSSPWHVWPVEMSMKTAMHYAISRGWAVIDDLESVKAISIAEKADFIQQPAQDKVIVDGGNLLSGDVSADDLMSGSASLEEHPHAETDEKTDDKPKSSTSKAAKGKTASKTRKTTKKAETAKTVEKSPEPEPEPEPQPDPEENPGTEDDKMVLGLKKLASAYECPEELIDDVVEMALESEDANVFIAEKPWQTPGFGQESEE